MRRSLKKIFQLHFEWIALATGLLFLGLMNPYIDNGSSWCLFEWAGITFCPGEGLGHSIAYTFRGDISNALQANAIGPFSIVIIISRIGILLKQNFFHNYTDK
ncbi:MAG: DUF2752 domain-containing protein [Balneolaceae bacterium]|nr:DUF2752 domain-containing protein [Balneolaceae bacterium]